MWNIQKTGKVGYPVAIPEKIQSNRGNYKNHWADFLLLLTDEGSYYEGQLFEDVAGLTGISTVKGLQYAYNNPQTYTVHTINSVNESVIDTLSLSANTKANMHFEVQTGGTVITPDKAVTDGAFSGVLYVVSHLEGDGDSSVSYFIGEQVANGGWSIDDFDEEEYCVDNECRAVYKAIKDKQIFLHEDSTEIMLDCNISEKAFNDTLEEDGWRPEYGYPCYVPDAPDGHYPLEYGDKQLTYKIATNATKFHYNGVHSYWHYNSDIKEMLDQYLVNAGLEDEDNNYRFSTVIGTYLMNVSNDMAIYYSPYEDGDNKGKVIMVEGAIFEKASENGNEVMGEVGYPVEVAENVQSGFGTQGDYQNFIGGAIYSITNGNDDLSGESFYVPLSLWKYYDDHGTVTGKFGFPVDDPVKHSELASYVTLSQDFEGTRISVDGAYVGAGQLQYDLPSATHSPVWYKKYDYPDAIDPWIDDINFLIVDLNPYLENRACFKTQVGLKDGNKIEDMVKEFQDKPFSDLLEDQNSKLTNSFGVEFEPIAAFNGDFVDDKTRGPKGISYTLGYDYSGSRNWTAMAISEDNNVFFIKRKMIKDPMTGEDREEHVYEMKERLDAMYKYNVVAGGPLIIEKGNFTKKTCHDLLGNDEWWNPDIMCYFIHDQRTIVGITENKYMIVLVANDGPWEMLEEMLNVYSGNYGKIEDANMFDGGGSPAMMFEGDIKRSDDPISSALFMYSGEACK